jgi:hypothetical protein
VPPSSVITGKPKSAQRLNPRWEANYGLNVTANYGLNVTDSATAAPSARYGQASGRHPRLDKAALAAGDDPLIARQRMRQLTLVLDREPVGVGGVEALSIPGPADPIPADTTGPTMVSRRR